MSKQTTQEDLVDAIDNLAYAVNLLREQADNNYTQFLIDIIIAVNETGRKNQEILEKIYNELNTSNKSTSEKIQQQIIKIADK